MINGSSSKAKKLAKQVAFTILSLNLDIKFEQVKFMPHSAVCNKCTMRKYFCHYQSKYD